MVISLETYRTCDFPGGLDPPPFWIRTSTEFRALWLIFILSLVKDEKNLKSQFCNKIRTWDFNPFGQN